MKRKFLSIFMMLAIMTTLVPSMSFVATAEESGDLSEVIAFNNKATAESEHFILKGEPSGDHWLIERYTIAGHDLTITSKDPNTVILSIEAVVPGYGWRYNEITFSSGEKVETGTVADGSTVHVNNINSNKLVITAYYADFWIKDFTIYYTHKHGFTGESKDNGDGTHSKKCSSADCFQYSNPEEHTYKPISRAGDDPLIFKAKCTDCTSTINDYKIENKSFTYTVSTTYGDVEEGDTLKGGTKLKANYSLGDADMTVYVDNEKVADVKEGEYWTASQCVECVKFTTNWFSSDPLQIWFKSICCDYTMATCENPETCMYCGHTKGVPLNHTWADATCTAPKTCKFCGVTDGEPLGHDYRLVEKKQDKTETSPAIYTAFCTRCDYTTDNLEVSAPDYTYDTTVSTDIINVGDFLKKDTVVTFKTSDYSILSAKIFVDNVEVKSINGYYPWTVPCCLKCVKKSKIWDIYDALYFETVCDFTALNCTTSESCVHCGYTKEAAPGHNFENGVCTVCAAHEKYEITLTVTGNEFSVTTKGYDANTGVVIVALYNNNKELLAVQTFDLSKGEIPSGSFTQKGNVLAMWWEDFISVKPYCDTVKNIIN